MIQPPLALYVHIPWCARKCPYCDFNSYPHRGRLPERAYAAGLLRDLQQDVALWSPPSPVTSVFIGGGTPSLLSSEAVAGLLHGIGGLVDLSKSAEITLEANPGSADAQRFSGYREAGVNRLSIGAQSLSATHLLRLGRIHGPQEVRSAVASARQAGFESLNLDLIYGLPGQSLAQARRDLDEALALGLEHLSYYQLTLEPNTAFHRAPPHLPDEDLIAEMHVQGAEMIAASGFDQYEVSAYARPGYRCCHNLNYWGFGDYLGIGAGAHGKVTDISKDQIQRYAKQANPQAYLEAAHPERLVVEKRLLSEEDRIVEFAMNALRLTEGFEPILFEQRTGVPLGRIAPILTKASTAGLLSAEPNRLRPTELGRRFLNDLLALFVQR